MILDGGTLEHVANMPAVFSAVWRGLSPGGLLVAGYPANNLCDHGYWQPQPRFFHEFFLVNGAEECSIQILRGLGSKDLQALRVLDYMPAPSGQAWQPDWANAADQVGIFMVARKSSARRAAGIQFPSEFS
jgi:hypothetical protein